MSIDSFNNDTIIYHKSLHQNFSSSFSRTFCYQQNCNVFCLNIRTYKECLAVMFYLIKWIYLLSYSIKHKLCLMGHKLIYTYHLTNLTSCHTLALNSNSFQGFRVIQKCCSKSSFYTSIKHNVFHFMYFNMVNKTHESTIKN